MSFELPITAKDRAAGRFIGRVRKALFLAASEAKEKSGLTQQNIADKLHTDKSVINRMLNGERNLTLRSVAEIAWALGLDIGFELRPRAAFTSSEGAFTGAEPGQKPVVNTPPPGTPLTVSNGDETLRPLFLKAA